ncbi:hypothetical protein D3C85_1730830 [compost metagenome]
MPPNWLNPRIVGRSVAKICASVTPCRIWLTCGISAIALCDRWLQSVSLMNVMPTFSLVPTKLKPTG